MLFFLQMSLSLHVCKLELNTGYPDQKKKKEAVIKNFLLTYSSQVIPDL